MGKLLELEGAIELGATLEAGVLVVDLDEEGVDDPPPPPPPQAVNSNVMLRQATPVTKLAGFFIRTPNFLSFLGFSLSSNVTGYLNQYTGAIYFQIVRLDLNH